SDWFVAPPSVMEGLYAAVTRITLDDRRPGGWVPEQRIRVEEALRAYTYGPAYASFEEKRKGTLETGKLADFVLLDRGLTKTPAHEIRNAAVRLTVAGGKIVHEAKP
ncbi:MAG TPA: amidohydrolase family protein, partial [Beijerinckiaceae bacterium]|nr:amidohydrolase family protein [Beijerinckiaceae bacterium]